MRKFLFFLILAAVLGGGGFFLGWAQLSVPVGSCAVIRSKTHGVDPNVIKNGEFRWVWYKLIPTNVAFVILKPQVYRETFSVTGELPQGTVYSRFTGLEADFSWRIAGEISFAVREESLPELVEEHGIMDQAALDAFCAETLGKMEKLVESRLAGYVIDAAVWEDIQRENLGERFRPALAAAYPYADDLSLSLSVTKAPDYDFYVLAGGLYQDYLERQRQVLEDTTTSQAGQQIFSQFELGRLEQYGELLSKYPVLVDFLVKMHANFGDFFSNY